MSKGAGGASRRAAAHARGGRSPPGLPIYLPTYLPAYLPTYLPTYLCTFLPTYLPIYLPTYLPTYLPIHPATYLPIGDGGALNSAHIRLSRPDSGPGFQVQVLKIFQVVSSWRSCCARARRPYSTRSHPRSGPHEHPRKCQKIKSEKLGLWYFKTLSDRPLSNPNPLFDPKSDTQIPKPETRKPNLKPETENRNPKTKNRNSNLKPDIRKQSEAGPSLEQQGETRRRAAEAVFPRPRIPNPEFRTPKP